MKKIILFVLLGIIVFCQEKSTVTVNLISPEPNSKVSAMDVELEGLIDRMDVEEIRVLVNSQPLRFVPVKKGYFVDSVHLDHRENVIVVMGATEDRNYFRQEFQVTNLLFKEKSLDEKIAPSIRLNILEPDTFRVIGPKQLENLKVMVLDNREPLTQIAWILDGKNPVYIKDAKEWVSLNLSPDADKKSHLLHIYAIDSDSNRTSQNYHFRIDRISCNLGLTPEYGIVGKTPLHVSVKMSGEQRELKYSYSLSDRRGIIKTFEEERQEFDLDFPSFSGKKELSLVLDVCNSNQVCAQCRSKAPVNFYAQDFQRTFQIAPETKLESSSQFFSFSFEPPVKTGEVTVLLRKKGESGVLDEDWKLLGKETLRSPDWKRFWTLGMKRRVPVGKYQMKLSMILGDERLTFTDAMDIEITRSLDDTSDLLEEILKDEY